MTDRFARVERVLRDACGRRFTGAVARIERGGELAFEAAYGTTRTDEASRAVYVDTRFDLASITKLFVATLALRLVAAGTLDLDGPLAGIFPEWSGTPHAAITLRMLVAHTSGMNSGADYRTILGENVERFALMRPLAGAPGESVIYSDLGFITLGAAIERARPGGRWRRLHPRPFGVRCSAIRRAAPNARRFRRPKTTGGADACKATCTTKRPTSWAAWPAMPACSGPPRTSRGLPNAISPPQRDVRSRSFR